MSELITYKPLETSFKSKGFDYRLLNRVGDVAMFEQSKPCLSGTWLEVVIVQKYGERTIGGVTLAPTEAMPPASAWGRYGWTYRDKAKANARFDKLVSDAVRAS